jgi:RNA recognition motif-containing protein
MIYPILTIPISSSFFDPYNKSFPTHNIASFLPTLPRHVIQNLQTSTVPTIHITTAMSSTLFLSNLPYAITDDELTDALTPYGTVVGIRKITDKYMGRRVPNGVAFVEFANSSELMNALSATLVIGGRSIVLQAAKPRVVHKRDSVFVSGIPVGTTKQDLLEAFAPYNPIDARVARMNSDTSRGYGFVKFASVDEQELAVRNSTHIMICGEESVARFANRGYDERPIVPTRSRSYRKGPVRGRRRVPRSTGVSDSS